MTSYKDLREFVKVLEEENELLRVNAEVDWKYEVSGWVWKSQRANGPALLFENIKGYPGHKLFTYGLGSYRRIALAMGLPKNTSVKELIKEYRRRTEKPLEPTLSKWGPCKENIDKGEAVNLLKFPVPHWHPRDGGRYMITWAAVISKDPETGVRNVGLYRGMIVDRNTIALGFLPFSHLGLHYSKAEERGEPLPLAIAIGCDELLVMAAAAPFPPGVDEMTMAGALKGEPIELVKCETIDLEVPANSEIVLEGELLPYERVEEGPFGEHTGYHGGPVRMRPIFKVKCVSYRNNPIFRGTLETKPICEDHVIESINVPAVALKTLEGIVPGVLNVYTPPFGDSWLSAIVQIRQYYVGHARDVAHVLLGSNVGRHFKVVIVVDEDIDPFNIEEVWWALTTRVQASRDIEIVRFRRTSRSDPSAPREGPEITDKMVIDATKKLDYPYEPAWGSTWAPTAIPPEEVLELVERKWKLYVEGMRERGLEEEIKALEDKVRSKEKEWEERRQLIRKLSAEEREKEKFRSYPFTARAPR